MAITSTQRVFEKQEIDTSTGEIIRATIVNRKTKSREHFVITYCQDLGALLKCTKGQVDLLIGIINLKFIEFETNELILNSSRRTELSEKTGLTLSTIYNLTIALKKKNILVENNGKLYLNPKLFFYGSELERMKMFSLSIDYTICEDC